MDAQEDEDAATKVEKTGAELGNTTNTAVPKKLSNAISPSQSSLRKDYVF